MKWRKFWGFRGKLPTTRWTIIVNAGQREVATRDKALADLCAIYWNPVYAFICAQGRPAEDARDLTQGFFTTQLIAKNDVAKVDRNRGRFRNWLLGAVKNYLANVRKHENGPSHYPGQPLISINIPENESTIDQHPSPLVKYPITPDRVFEQRWALTLLNQALGKLAKHYERPEEQALLDKMIPYLVHATSADHKSVAEELGIPENNFNVALHRCRIQFRACIRDEIAETVLNEEEIEDELRYIRSGLQAH